MPNNFVFIVMDSCRYDSFVRARTPNIDRLGAAQQRWSYASWTAPSHYAFFMGLMPHRSLRRVYASEVYKKEFSEWVPRLELPELSFATFVPEISLAKVLKDHGYRCSARVSMPVINSFTPLNQHFDDYRLMDDHNDFAGMVEEVDFQRGERQFYFFNLGETHYPYMLDDDSLPHISGVHGVFKGLGSGVPMVAEAEEFFEPEALEALHARQVECVEYVDGLVGELLAKCPKNTHLVVTSDHGELFGEDGYFGHGPIMHEKCFEVPFIEGRRP